ncbi:hypothetical protein ACROYT_G012328 [Oculina patagonica]
MGQTLPTLQKEELRVRVQMDEEVTNLENQLTRNEDMKEMRVNHEKAISDLRRQLNVKDLQITDLRSDMEQQLIDNRELQQQFKISKEQLTKQETEKAVQQERLRYLEIQRSEEKKQVKILRGQVQNLKTELGTKDKKLSRLDTERVDMQEQPRKLQEQLKEKDTEELSVTYQQGQFRDTTRQTKDLPTQITNLLKQLQEKQKCTKKVEKQLKGEQNRAYKLESELGAHKHQLPQNQHQFAYIQRELGKGDTENEHEQLKVKHQQVSQLDRQLIIREQQLEAKQKELTDLKLQLKRNDAEKASLKTQIGEEGKRVHSLQGQLKTKEEELAVLKQKLQERDIEREKYQQCTQLEADLNAKEQELEKMQKQLKGIKRDKDKLQGHLRVQQSKNEQLVQKQEQLNNLQEQLRRKDKDVGTLEQQLTVQKQRVSDLQSQLTGIQEQSQEKHQQIIDMQRRMDTIREQLEQNERKEEQVEKTLNSCQEQIQAITAENETLQEQLRRTQGQVSELESDLRTKEQGLALKTEQVTHLEEQLHEKDEQVSDLQRQVGTMRDRVNELDRTYSSENRRTIPNDWVINRKEIQMTEEELGFGAWGRVVQGKFRRSNVAVKQIHEVLLSPHSRTIFEREVGIASRCRHPCLLQFIGATNDDKGLLLVTELMDRSLRSLYEERPLTEGEISVISLDVAQALNYLHQNKPKPIIHCYISSANVLLWRQGDQWRGKVSDYGTANFVRQCTRDHPGAVKYCAPEALDGAEIQIISCKGDVYSFGVLICEMHIRELPDPQRRDGQVKRFKNRRLRSHLIIPCLRHKPAWRPDMEEIIDELENQFHGKSCLVYFLLPHLQNDGQVVTFKTYVANSCPLLSLQVVPWSKPKVMTCRTSYRVRCRSDSLSTWRGASAAGMASATMLRAYSSVCLMDASGALSTGNLFNASAVFSLPGMCLMLNVN